jgi:hypothetical protein
VSESRESRMVTLRRKPDGTPAVWCDPEIADLVSALNAGGVPTVASCSGHGERPGNIALADGRELIIAKDYAEARAIEACWNTRHAQQPAAYDMAVLTPTGTFCSVCEAPQHNTPSGVSCPNGHGGAAAQQQGGRGDG